MTLLDLVPFLLVGAALIAAFNAIVLKASGPMAMLATSLVVAIATLGVDAFFPALGLHPALDQIVSGIDFEHVLLEGILGLLLFAGALHVRVEELRRQLGVVLIMATIGVLISAGFIGLGFSLLTGMPLMVALVFGAIITPTDPVAVMGALKTAKVPTALEAKVAGESLLNDGAAYVLFLILAGIAFAGPDAEHAGAHAGRGGAGEVLMSGASLFLREMLGGAALGAGLGWIAFRLMRLIDDYVTEILITLALVTGGYMLSHMLHVSAPIMAVLAGLFIGHVGRAHGMSDLTRSYVDKFWHIIDELLNLVLFMAIGIEVFAIDLSWVTFAYGLAAIGLSLGARMAAVGLPLLALRPWRRFSTGAFSVLIWGGIKGGISIALALSLPESEWRPVILAASFIVVIFSILVQGLTMGRVALWATRAPQQDGALNS